MKVKSVTIETDKGAEITMSLEEVDDFMKAMHRLKKSCAEPKPVRQIQMIEEQKRAEEGRRRLAGQPKWGSTSNQALSASSLRNSV